jgi:hypothetical protein
MSVFILRSKFLLRVMNIFKICFWFILDSAVSDFFIFKCLLRNVSLR